MELNCMKIKELLNHLSPYEIARLTYVLGEEDNTILLLRGYLSEYLIKQEGIEAARNLYMKAKFDCYKMARNARLEEEAKSEEKR